jgi:hypothetical protein
MPVFGGLPTDWSAVSAAQMKLKRTALRIAIILHLQYESHDGLPAWIQEEIDLAGIHHRDIRQIKSFKGQLDCEAGLCELGDFSGEWSENPFESSNPVHRQ